MTVVIYPGSSCALTAPSLSRITSLTQSLLLNVISTFGFAFSLNRNRKDDRKFVGCLSTRFGVQNFRMAHTTLAHTLKNYHVSQFGH